MAITITSTKSFSGTNGNYSLSETFSGSALSSASETVGSSSAVDVEVFANNASSELKFLAVKSDKSGSFQLEDSSGTLMGSSQTLTANVSKVLFGTALTGADFYNDGDIHFVKVTNNETTEATVVIDMLYDATP